MNETLYRAPEKKVLDLLFSQPAITRLDRIEHISAHPEAYCLARAFPQQIRTIFQAVIDADFGEEIQ